MSYTYTGFVAYIVVIVCKVIVLGICRAIKEHYDQDKSKKSPFGQEQRRDSIQVTQSNKPTADTKCWCSR